jgi:hypothetical protein
MAVEHGRRLTRAIILKRREMHEFLRRSGTAPKQCGPPARPWREIASWWYFRSNFPAFRALLSSCTARRAMPDL